MSIAQEALWQSQLKLLAQERDAIAAHCDTLEKTLKHTQEIISGTKLILEQEEALGAKFKALTAEITEALGQGVPSTIIGSVPGIWDPPAPRAEGAV